MALVEQHVQVANDMSSAVFVNVIDQLDQAIAIIDSRLDRVVWHSKAWRRYLPSLSNTESWSSAVQSCPAIAALLQEATQPEIDGQNTENTGNTSTGAGMADGPVRLPTGEVVQLAVRTLADARVVLQLHSSAMATDDMHLYMQAREHMFTTSRTISVSEMATTLAHEIKQPIGTITNILRGVKLRLAQPSAPMEQIEQALDKALEQANFTSSVITRIREFTQARRPQQQMLDLGKLTRDSLSLMDWLLSASQCRVELQVSDEPMACKGDPTMLQQVLVNLLRNGIEAMDDLEPVERCLKIECAPVGQNIRVSIHDNGHGLEGKEQTLFVPFATSKSSGMGVGLNICRSFIELHQGRLWLSPNAAEGCTSCIELPLVQQTDAESTLDPTDEQVS